MQNRILDSPSSLLHCETTDSYLLLAAFRLKTDGALGGVSVCLKEKPLRRQEPRCYAASSQFDIRTSPDNFTDTPQRLPSKRLQTLPNGSCCRLVCDVVKKKCLCHICSVSYERHPSLRCKSGLFYWKTRRGRVMVGLRKRGRLGDRNANSHI